jgi:hypothetical protein
MHEARELGVFVGPVTLGLFVHLSDQSAVVATVVAVVLAAVMVLVAVAVVLAVVLAAVMVVVAAVVVVVVVVAAGGDDIGESLMGQGQKPGDFCGSEHRIQWH